MNSHKSSSSLPLFCSIDKSKSNPLPSSSSSPPTAISVLRNPNVLLLLYYTLSIAGPVIPSLLSKLLYFSKHIYPEEAAYDMFGNGKNRWFGSLTRSSGSGGGGGQSDQKLKSPPGEFICPITGVLMFEPVVITSGQTFERLTVQVCKELGFCPVLDDGSRTDFTASIPNLALRKTILNWCDKSGTAHPPAPDYYAVQALVRNKMEASWSGSGQIRPSERELLRGVAENPPLLQPHAVSEVGHRVNRFHTGSSEESTLFAETPLPLTRRPQCYSSFSSSSDQFDDESLTHAPPPLENLNPQEEDLIAKFISEETFEQENGVIRLRRITRSSSENRASLCTPRLISALKPLLVSRYNSVQVNAVASVVNLSLDNPNKVKLVRSGVVPLLIDVLKGGFVESQEHAAGALFSLALDDDSKMAIGVLGALPPLLHALRSESERTRHDSALALYNLTLVQSNRIKLIKLSAIPTLLSMVKSGSLASRVLLILCNLAACLEGRSAMLDSNGVGILVGLLRDNEVDSESTRENCVAALHALSHGSLRFKGLARDAKAVEVLKEVEENGTDRAREKARRLLEVMKGRESGEDVHEDLYPADGDPMNRARYRSAMLAAKNNIYSANSTDF